MELRYTEHLKLRMKLRDIPYAMPKKVYEEAEERYYDTSTFYYIAMALSKNPAISKLFDHRAHSTPLIYM